MSTTRVFYWFQFYSLSISIFVGRALSGKTVLAIGIIALMSLAAGMAALLHPWQISFVDSNLITSAVTIYILRWFGQEESK